MATEATIQKHVSHGYGIAAKHLGHLFVHYRPQSTGTVLTNINAIDELMMAYDPDPLFGFIKPLTFKSDEYYGLVDLTTVAIGDYFYDFKAGTFFVANFEPLKSALIIRCNAIASIFRPTSSNGYGANTGPSPLMTGWPVSILPGTKGERNVAGLPESVRAPWVVIHVPIFAGVDILYGDVITDDLNRRYVVSQNQKTSFGSWHLTCDYESA